MKKSYFIILSIILLSCGTLGSFNTVSFPISKDRLLTAIDTVYKMYPKYQIPENWQKFNDWSERGYDFLESKIFYFDTAPKEMYYVTILNDSTDNSEVSMSVRAVCKGTDKWFIEEDLSTEEVKRIENRFDTAIVKKIRDVIRNQ
jgi:hypothetical protein